jgi:hypothetical protein
MHNCYYYLATRTINICHPSHHAYNVPWTYNHSLFGQNHSSTHIFQVKIHPLQICFHHHIKTFHFKSSINVQLVTKKNLSTTMAFECIVKTSQFMLSLLKNNWLHLSTTSSLWFPNLYGSKSIGSIKYYRKQVYHCPPHRQALMW